MVDERAKRNFKSVVLQRLIPFFETDKKDKEVLHVLGSLNDVLQKLSSQNRVSTFGQ